LFICAYLPATFRYCIRGMFSQAKSDNGHALGIELSTASFV
jgi:hypothetical protein